MHNSDVILYNHIKLFMHLFENLKNRKKDRTEKLYKQAFTLAEVLITLGIIGIVAAMTLPSVINSAQNLQYKSAYKKAYSEFSQALMISLNNGEIISRTQAYDSIATESEWNALKSKFKIVKECEPKELYSCWAQGDTFNGMPNTGYGKAFVDEAGRSWALYFSSENIYFVDINGYKKPNIFGKDRFIFFLFDAMFSINKGLPTRVIPEKDYTVKNTWCNYPPCYYESWLLN